MGQLLQQQRAAGDCLSYPLRQGVPASAVRPASTRELPALLGADHLSHSHLILFVRLVWAASSLAVSDEPFAVAAAFLLLLVVPCGAQQHWRRQQECGEPTVAHLWFVEALFMLHSIKRTLQLGLLCPVPFLSLVVHCTRLWQFYRWTSRVQRPIEFGQPLQLCLRQRTIARLVGSSDSSGGCRYCSLTTAAAACS